LPNADDLASVVGALRGSEILDTRSQYVDDDDDDDGFILSLEENTIA
jgi:hypothetical protein